tara:strand:+ start:182 stop:445 length:264 start_codon:yes stop_codon:yes gene_type:complete
MTTTPEAPFFFRGPDDIRTGSGANFQMTFPNGFTVSVANTTLTNSDVQRIEVAILRDGEIINHDEIEWFVTPERVLAIMLETALRTA